MVPLPLLLLLPFLLFCPSAYSQSSNGPSTCVTPDRLPGTCVGLRSCAPLYALISGRPLSKDVIVILQRAKCGFVKQEPKVCCPTTAASSDGEASLPRSTSTTPPPEQAEDDPVDVTKEPNLSLLPADVCGPINSNRIIGGNKTSLFEFPWMARIGYRSRELSLEGRNSSDFGEELINIRSGLTGDVAYRCGGSLISDRYVLTAAHCVEGLKPGEVLSTVRLGENNILSEVDCAIMEGRRVCASPVQDVDVEEIRAHPQFSTQGQNRLQNDIALIRLVSRVPFTDSVRPICLPVGVNQAATLNNKKVVVAGWGTTETGFSSPDLLRVMVAVVRSNECINAYSHSLRISASKQLCAGGSRDGDSCNGDSGGPLQFAGLVMDGSLREIQYGVVSFGPRRCGTDGMPGVYTRVGFYMQWLLRNLRP